MSAAMTSLYSPPTLLAAGTNRGRGDGPWHAHPAPEVVLVREGPYCIAVGNLLLPGDTGTLYVLPPNVPHAVRAPGWRTTTYLVFRQAHRLIDERPRMLDARGEPLFARWFDDLHTLARRDPRLADPVADGILSAVLHRIARLEDAGQAAALHPALQRAVRYLEAQLDRPAGTEALARAAHTSYGHLCRLFRETFHCTPRAFQHRLRLDRAKKLLLDPYLTVKEVAARCGFEDVNYFVRLFRREERQTPGRWRKQQR